MTVNFDQGDDQSINSRWWTATVRREKSPGGSARCRWRCASSGQDRGRRPSPIPSRGRLTSFLSVHCNSIAILYLILNIFHRSYLKSCRSGRKWRRRRMRAHPDRSSTIRIRLRDSASAGRYTFTPTQVIPSDRRMVADHLSLPRRWNRWRPACRWRESCFCSFFFGFSVFLFRFAFSFWHFRLMLQMSALR